MSVDGKNVLALLNYHRSRRVTAEKKTLTVYRIATRIYGVGAGAGPVILHDTSVSSHSMISTEEHTKRKHQDGAEGDRSETWRYIVPVEGFLYYPFTGPIYVIAHDVNSMENSHLYTCPRRSRLGSRRSTCPFGYSGFTRLINHHDVVIDSYLSTQLHTNGKKTSRQVS